MIALTAIGSALWTGYSLFKSGPIARYAMIGGAGLLVLTVATGTANIMGRMSANAKWEKRGLENQIKVLTVDAQIQRNVAELAKQAEAGLAAKAEKLEQELQEYIRNVPKNGACLATDDDVRGLRNVGREIHRRSDRSANPFRLRKSR